MSRRREGFTLVEIMIVVAIIGILIAIALPGFIRAREVSRFNACQENWSKIDGAIQQYVLEHGIEDSLSYCTIIGAPSLQASPGDPAWLSSGAGAIVGPLGYLRSSPKCPAGGTYGIYPSPAGRMAVPLCSLVERDISPAHIPPPMGGVSKADPTDIATAIAIVAAGS